MSENTTDSKAYSSGKIDAFKFEDLELSEKTIGQIYPVIKDANGNILDGYHRKRVNPKWKEIELPIEDKLEGLKIRIHLNILRRPIPQSEKERWITKTRELLQARGLKGTQKEIANALGMSRTWVSKYDPLTHLERPDSDTPCHFYGYNVWGFKNEDWRKLILPGDANQPDKDAYHGSTPSFVIHQLIQMFQPKTVLDSMAGVGTTGYVCRQYDGIEYDQFDIYPYPKYGIIQGDAETIRPNKIYDLIFNHIPYLRMVKYGNNPADLSIMNLKDYLKKLRRIFKKNYDLLKPNGIYAVLVGDWRHQNKLVPLTAHVTNIGPETGFELYDEAIKLSGEQRGKELQEYRAAKYGYLAQTFDSVLIFRKKVSSN